MTSKQKIYTKTGDRGETALFFGPRVAKDELRIALCGDLDELSATLGIVRAEGLSAQHERMIFRIQNELLQFGAEIVCGDPSRLRGQTLNQEHVRQLEREIDDLETALPPLHRFVIPGENKASAYLHLARTVCRRAERSLVTLARNEPNLTPVLLAYLNRLSDWLFVLARSVQARPAENDAP